MDLSLLGMLDVAQQLWNPFRANSFLALSQALNMKKHVVFVFPHMIEFSILLIIMLKIEYLLKYDILCIDLQNIQIRFASTKNCRGNNGRFSCHGHVDRTKSWGEPMMFGFPWDDH